MRLFLSENNRTATPIESMKRIVSKLKLLFNIVILFFLVSCLAEENPNGYGDAFIVAEMVGQDTLKGLSLHAFANTDFSSVTVNQSGNMAKTYVLSPYMGYRQDFMWNTPVSQLSRNLPATGDYVFNATFKDGQSQILYDKLATDYLLPPEMKVCEYILSSDKINVEWSAVPKANVYNIKLINLNDSVLFVSEVFNSGLTKFSFGKNTPGWQSATVPLTGQNVNIEIAAYLLESVSSLNQLQAVSKTHKTITWGIAN